MSTPIGTGPSSSISFSLPGQAPEPQSHGDSVRTMASLSLTLPPPPQSGGEARQVSESRADEVRTVLRQPLQGNSAPSRAEVAQRKMEAAADKLKEARQSGVDIAKSSFWKKMLGVATSAVAVGVAIGLTVASFGGAGPLLGLACATFAVSAGDAVCAFRNMKNAQAAADGQPPPYEPLPMGNSIVANLAHGVLTRCGVSESTATGVAKAIGITVGAGLAIASAAVALGATALPGAYEITARVASGVNTVVAGYATLGASLTDEMDREDVRDATRDIAQTVGQALEDPGLDAQGRDHGARIMESLTGEQSSPEALLGLSMEQAGRTKEAVVGATGALQVGLKVTGGASMMVGMMGLRG